MHSRIGKASADIN